MSPGIKSICTKAGILMLAFLLCLPCSLKRELKQDLQLPVATHTQQHNQEQPCPITIRKSGPSYSATAAVKKQDNTVHFFAAYPAHKTHPRLITLPLQLPSMAVPLYIRYEQYLI